MRGHLHQMRRKKLVTKFRGRWYRLLWDPDVVAREFGVADVPAARKARHQQERQRFWDGRASLSDDHRDQVVRLEADGGVVTYVHPHTGEVLWSYRPQPPSPSDASN